MTTPTASDDPLHPFLDPGTRRARFAVPVARDGGRPLVTGLLAGAAEVDITPPPGLPKAGYSANARTGTGFRTRLRARVVHLRAGTTSLALVACDLLGGSAVLQHLVARRIAATTDVPLAGLFIGATHTHAGPGQYLGTDFYNRYASNAPGFDPAWAAFLVDRISGAVTEAVAARRPALAAFGTAEVWGLTRNRSLAAHLRNHPVAGREAPPQRKFHAVNPALHLLRVDAAAAGGGHEPLAGFTVFSVHGTGIPMQADEYNADLWAYLVGELGHRVEATHGVRPVLGAVEGTHADVAPALDPGGAGHREAARVGRAIGAEAAALFERLGAELRDDVALGAGLREVDLERNRSVAGVALPRRPAVGAALVAGAHENLTPVIGRIPPFRAGFPKPHRPGDPQGAKWVLGTRWLQPLVLPTEQFPRVLPVHVIRVGDTLLTGLPFEVTVEAGRTVAAAVTGVAHAEGISRVVVSSVANEYSGYVATAAEYAEQCYEGGHTLYGPSTAAFLAAHATAVAAQVVRGGGGHEGPARRTFDLRVVPHLARATAEETARAATIERRVLQAPAFTDPTVRRDGHWELEWVDAPPGALAWHEPMVHVEVDAGDGAWRRARHRGIAVDDQGWALQVTALGPLDPAEPGGAHRYRVRWWDPALHGRHRYRFVITTGSAGDDHPALTSDPFH